MVRTKRNTLLALGFTLVLGAVGCTTSPLTTSASTPADNASLRTGYGTQQITGETIRFCRARFRRCFRELSQTLPASQANEECRDNYDRCLTQNEGYFYRGRATRR